MTNKKNIWLLILALGLASGTRLVDSFVFDIPRLLKYILTAAALIAMIAFLSNNREINKKS